MSTVRASFNEIAKEIKSRVSLASVVGRYVQLRREGKGYRGLCPFHADREPSLFVYDDGSFRCFGCQAHGDCFDFVRRMHKIQTGQEMTLQQAINEVSQMADSPFKRVAPQRQVEAQKMSLEQWAECESVLWQHPGAEPIRQYLVARGISIDTARRFHLGALLRGTSLVKILPDASPEERERREAMQNSPWLAIPYIRDGRVVYVKYRAVSDDVANRYMGDVGAQPDFFNEETIDPYYDLFLTEGEIDAITIEQAGFRAVSFGSASKKLSPRAREILRRVSRVFIAGDNDESGVGMAAMERMLREIGTNAHILLWPRGDARKMDANDYFVTVCGGDAGKFRAELERLREEAAQPNSPHFKTVRQIIEQLRERETPLEDPNRLGMPWRNVDRMALITRGDTVGIFAMQGCGKSSFVTQICLHNALRGKAVLIWTPDLKPYRHTRLIVAQLTKSDKSLLGPMEYDRALLILGDANIYLGYDPDALRADRVLDICEMAVQRLEGQILVIDHINAIVQNVADKNPVNVYEDVLGRLNAMAEKYGLINLVVAQERKRERVHAKYLNRPAELEDLRWASALIDYSSAVIHLHRDRLRGEKNLAGYEEESGDLLSDRVLVRMLKGREQAGARQYTYLHFNGSTGTFEEEVGNEIRDSEFA